MKTALIFLCALACAGCVTTSRVDDRRALEESLHFTNFTLPAHDEPDTVSDDVKQLLGAPLTEASAVRIALLNNRETRALVAELGISRGRAVQADTLPNPDLEFEARDPGGPQPAQLDVGLEYNLSALWLTPLRSSVATAELDADRLRVSQQLLGLTYRAKIAFHRALAASQRLELHTRALAAQRAHFAAAEELHRVGNLTALEFANSRAALETSQVQVAEAELAELDAREMLNQVLGVHGGATQWSLGAPPSMPAEDLLPADAEKRAILASLELKELDARLDAASRKVRLAQTEGWLPHLSAGFHGEKDGLFWEMGGHLAVAVPVFDRLQGRELAARSEYDGLRSRLEGTATQIRSSARMALNRVESSGRRVRHFSSRLLPSRQRALEETLLQYNAMQLGVFQVLLAQRAVTETALAQVDASLDYWTARAALDAVLAGKTPGFEAQSTTRVSAAPTEAH